MQGVSLEQCELILGLLLARKFGLATGVRNEDINQVAWSRPKGFSKRGQAVSISFPHKRTESEFFDIKVSMERKQLTIVELLRAAF